jgi:hypothetical protein
MHVHHLIDYLRSSTELDRECARLIERSHKFALNPGEIPEEILQGGNEYARQLMAAEIFPMPFDSCLFEFGPSGIVQQSPGLNLLSPNDWLWVMAWRERIDSASGWAIYFRSFCHFEKMGAPLAMAGVGQIFTDDGFDDTGEHGYFRLVGIDAAAESGFNRGCDRYRSSPQLKRNLDSLGARLGISAETMSLSINGIREEFVSWTSDMMDRAFSNLLSVLGLMSTSAGVTIDTVLPTKKFVNAIRARKGRALLEYEHKVVRIDPALTRIPGVVALGGSHASPRMHWRRGHVRTLADGRKVQVKPCVVGDVARGTIAHDYVVRPAPVPLSSRLGSVPDYA